MSSALEVGSLPPGELPLGATPLDDGVLFAVWSGHARSIELCLFDARGAESRWPMARRAGGEFAVFVRHAQVGQPYGFRADGPWSPAQGHRFNPAKLLLDPYARQIHGDYDPSGPVADSPPGDSNTRCPLDDAASKPRSVVAAPLPPLPAVPLRPRHELVVYEAHVARLTEHFSAIPEAERGTFAALAHPALLDHLEGLGVTALELMPVLSRMSEPDLRARGLHNEWGYSPVGFLALDSRFARPGVDPREDLRRAALALRERGIELWIDVVYNHSAELGLGGPVFHLRGLDHASYYRLTEGGQPIDTTGCGNSLRSEHPRVIELLLASLRELAEGCGVTGFRFDLALCVGRDLRQAAPPEEAMRRSPFFRALQADPRLSALRCVVEPWDLQGYALGGFRAGTLEWNDRYRDGVRRFFLGEPDRRADFATRISGSRERFVSREAGDSVNFVTAHDGFTLADLVSYAHKHNEPNGEGNRDGHEPNFSENFGVEGPTGDPQIQALRLSKQKALLLTLWLSAGTPMLAMGDELSRSQQGNNNAYCQTHPLRWPEAAGAAGDLRAFVRRLSAQRARASSCFAGTPWSEQRAQWLEPNGAPVRDWRAASSQLALWLRTEAGELWIGWNGAVTPARFQLPPPLRAIQQVESVRSDEHLDDGAAWGDGCMLHGRSACAVWLERAQ